MVHYWADLHLIAIYNQVIKPLEMGVKNEEADSTLSEAPPSGAWLIKTRKPLLSPDWHPIRWLHGNELGRWVGD